ncbi:HTH-type transcriptional regulator GltR [Sporomusa acidovorans DSM 3132]|uniref:HTH-type transcriptional regulator GltR n=1 Tax=Sporomusa acidovorans (strain ATCC 49682 / DSM 3132 / Mol) TaxID=1123286 RepID=A0ABZ3J9P1_SPOA4|nr:HTH-type transcriptional regulator GltR [Sporomusa acidovorans DSM 3132]SDE30143.1 DNA-binding transcriptional regulator, LysR family [Sporomusa acidovorans]
MEIRQLKTFISIVKFGNFSQAAQFLGYTQSTATTHIQLLEKELNTVLFERFGHQLMLTSDGERLYDYAERITKLADEAKNALDDLSIPRGPIVIGMPESLCVYRLNEILQEYAIVYPEVELKVKLGISSDFRTLLRKNMMDMAFFLESNIDEPDLVSKWLWPEPVILAASPSHPLSKLTAVAVKDLEGQTLIFPDSGSSYRTLLEESMEKMAVQPGNVLEICQIEVIKQFVISNVGLTILPYAAVQGEVTAGTLIALPWQGPDFKINAYLAYHKEKWLSPTIHAFYKLIQERLLK